MLSNFYLIGQPCGFQVHAGDDLLIELGDSVELDGQVSIPLDQIMNVLWTPNIDLSCQECYTTFSSTTEDICYMFSATDFEECTVIDTICVFIDTPMNANDIDLDYSVQLYPNPTSDILTIDLDSNNFSAIEIYNFAGELIRKDNLINSNIQTIDVSRLPDGIFFIKIKLDSHFVVRRFVKNKI